MSDDDEEDLEGGEELEEEEDTIGAYIGDRNLYGERHGNGWAILPSKDQYDGEYRRGHRHGEGIYVFRNGARYIGRYRCGKKYGKGTFYYPDGSIYEGEWRKNMKNGYGIYTYANGDMYKGNWYKNQRHGVGVYVYKEDEVCFKATWKSGIRIGPIEICFGKHKYHGYWDKHVPKGRGMFSFDCKYLLNGYYKPVPSYSDKNYGEEGEETYHMQDPHRSGVHDEDLTIFSKDESIITDFVPTPEEMPVWVSQDIQCYDFSKLPQQPIPLPLVDSEDSICDVELDVPKEGPELPVCTCEGECDCECKEEVMIGECDCECQETTVCDDKEVEICVSNLKSSSDIACNQVK